MRNIKFRALCEVEYKESSSKVMMIYFSHLELDNGLWFNPDDKNIYHINEWLSKPMQFTGKIDREGNEIYENDIITFDAYEWNRGSFTSKDKWEYPKWIVTWNENEAQWDLGGGTASETSTYKEVIGNIHENKDLLDD